MYSDLEATLHDVFWDAEESANELPLIEAFLNHSAESILDVGCGSGRFLLPLAQKGYAIEGLELSSDMLSLARKAAHEAQIDLPLHGGDMRTFQTETRYHSVLLPAFSLQLVSRDDALLTLKNLRSLSSPNAQLYFSVFIPWAEITDALEPDQWHLDKEAPYQGSIARCYTRHSIQRVEQILQREHRYELEQNGKAHRQHTATQTLQWYFLPELQSILKQSGWKMTTWHADFELNQQDSDASILTLFAQAV